MNQRLTVCLSFWILFWAMPATSSAGVFEWQSWWNAGLTQGDGDATVAHLDGATNDLLVAGSVSTGTDSQHMILRLDPLGDVLWWTLWPGGEPGSIQGRTIGSTGDTFVAARVSVDSVWFCRIAKFNPAGVREWQIDSPYEDACRTLAADDSGRVYSLGWDSATGWQIAAFATDGTFRWHSEIPEGISFPSAVDIEGARIVIGGRDGYGTDSDFLVSVLRTSTGWPVWTNTWDGAGEEDWIEAVEIVGDHVFAAGASDDASRDLAVVRFDLDDGALAASTHTYSGHLHDYPFDLVELDGDVVVTGLATQGSDWDLYLARLNPDLSTEWSVVYDPGQFSTNYGRSVQVSPDGTTLYAWGDHEVYCFLADGSYQWHASLDGDLVTGAATDSGARSVGSLSQNGGMLLASVDDVGQIDWMTSQPEVMDSLDSPGDGPTFELRHAADVNAAGTSVVAVNSVGKGTSLLRFGADGSFLGNAVDGMGLETTLRAAAIDEAGRFFALGNGQNLATQSSGRDLVFYGFTASGEAAWSQVFDQDELDDSAFLVRVHPSGGPVFGGTVSVEVAGGGGGGVDLAGGKTAGEGGTAGDFAVWRYDADGALLWQQQIDGLADSNDVMTALEVDDQGRIFVSGVSYDESSGGCLVAAFDAAGSLLWQRRLDLLPDEDEICHALALTVDGRVVVPISEADFSAGGVMVQAYDAATGVDVWCVPGDPAVPGGFNSIVATSDGVAVSTSIDVSVLRLDSSGAQLWQNELWADDENATAVLAYDAETDDVLVSAFGESWLVGPSGALRSRFDPSGVSGERDVLWATSPTGRIVRVSSARRVGMFYDLMVAPWEGIDVFTDGFESGDTSAWSSTVD